jgi:hypothetical protein
MGLSRSTVGRAGFGVGLVLLSLGILNAQTGQGKISGTVTDAQGPARPRVSIKVVSAETGFTVSTTTGASGLYNVEALNPNLFSVLGSLGNPAFDDARAHLDRLPLATSRNIQRRSLPPDSSWRR